MINFSAFKDPFCPRKDTRICINTDCNSNQLPNMNNAPTNS